MALIKKLRKKKKEAPANEKPDVVKTHLRNMVIVPEMTGSIVGVYNGKTFNQVCTHSYRLFLKKTCQPGSPGLLSVTIYKRKNPFSG